MKTYLLTPLSFFFFTSILFSQTLQWQKLNGPFGETPLCFVSKGSERFVGIDQNQGGVFRSSDDETEWGQESSGIALADRAISLLAVDDSGYTIAGTSRHIGNWVYKSKDNGESWVKIADLRGTSVTKNDSSHIFIGGNYTRYRSTYNGTTWGSINLGITKQDVRSVAIENSDYLYAVPWGYSLYKTTTSTFTSIENEGQLPSLFYLEQNYPNLFNPSTTIRFSIPTSPQSPASQGGEAKLGWFVTLKVYDVLGNEIAILVNEKKPPGGI